MSNIIHFQAEIQQHENMNAAFVKFPFDTEDLFGTKGQIKIKVLFDDSVEYLGSLANMGKGHCLILTQATRKQLGKSFGNLVDVKLWKDTEERIVIVPDDVKILFDEHPKAKELYTAMAYTHRKEYMRWIEDAKKEETRERRKVKMIEMILDGKKGI
ncbi:DUF1905 domain-containing protein [Chryseobacterium sp. POL2]|uniref:YdeI/OmpD-associated family protein n=1 Tax=Chryseobacterium sp. POL2 TaxID=2713414 RepID=UPI0013E18C90|nr:YdeI/OmpD-associated family protein [Chryseobacterium sp. POL2]QIG90016.1 DUF1905 domain-containing protein [Chryseobacterium sp. POL2]